VSELLTYSCTGTLSDPVWKPKHISNLAKVPAQVISEMTNIPIEGLKKIGQGIFGPQVKREETGGPGPGDAPGDAVPPRRLFQLRQN
jgi:hypothetical protein